MVSTPEVVIRFVGKGELRRLGAQVKRIYRSFRSGLRREERVEKGREGERTEEDTERRGRASDSGFEVEIVARKRPSRRWGRKVKPAVDHPWRRSYMKK